MAPVQLHDGGMGLASVRYSAAGDWRGRHFHRRYLECGCGVLRRHGSEKQERGNFHGLPRSLKTTRLDGENHLRGERLHATHDLRREMRN